MYSQEMKILIHYFSFLLSLIHVIEGKVLFWSQVFEIKILIDLHVMSSAEFENHIFSVWYLCICVCYQHNSNTYCSRNIKFAIFYLYMMLLKSFYKDQTKTLCTREQRRVLIHSGL